MMIGVFCLSHYTVNTKSLFAATACIRYEYQVPGATVAAAAAAVSCPLPVISAAVQGTGSVLAVNSEQQ